LNSQKKVVYLCPYELNRNQRYSPVLLQVKPKGGIDGAHMEFTQST
jgi:hypothetical protein